MPFLRNIYPFYNRTLMIKNARGLKTRGRWCFIKQRFYPKNLMELGKITSSITDKANESVMPAI